MTYLSNYPDYWLINLANEANQGFVDEVDKVDKWCSSEVDRELDLRQPDEAKFYFGDCAGMDVFLPIEREYDSNGNPIVEEVAGYDDEGQEIWERHNE